ncbi:MAG: hypothetical protein M1482_04090 [Chloroflexi bacterium]|nr:hypothetical protein [Chloroflexota bacterium]
MNRSRLASCLLLTVISVNLISCSTITSLLPNSGPASSDATFTDPFAYCRAVGTIDIPDARYTGDKMPETLAKGLQKASGASPDAPLQMFVQNSFWRCMDGKVYACTVGANLPCESKGVVSKTPTPGETDYCKSSPDSEYIPAVVTGHDTVYAWRCTAGAPTVVKQVFTTDAQGYIAEIWYVINPS